jgi:putative sigma-54 modulation protein
VQIKISSRHGHLSEESQSVIRDKVSKLPHYFERLTSIEATVDLKSDHQKTVELLVSAEHKHDFVARESHTDVMVAVDMVVEKMEGQLRRYKEKVQDHRRTPSVGEGSGASTQQEPLPE